MLVLATNVIINYYLTIFSRSVIDTFLEDYKSNNSDNGSIYSANISLEDHESNDSDDGLEDHGSNDSDNDLEDHESNDSDNNSIYFTNIPLDDYEFNNLDDDSIYSADIALEDYGLNEDVINDTNRLIDFGKNFNYLYIIQFL
jgi:hypothetical protein